MIKYKLAVEISAPTFYDIETNEKLDDECQDSPQRLWVVSYDTETGEIEEWVKDFLIGEENEAKEYIKNKEKGEQIMTDQELYDKMESEFKTYRDKKLAEGIKDYDFYGIAVRYELVEWVGSRLLESEDKQGEIELLKSKRSPLQYLYDKWLKTEDNLWNAFEDMLWDEAKIFKENK